MAALGVDHWLALSQEVGRAAVRAERALTSVVRSSVLPSRACNEKDEESEEVAYNVA